MSIPADIPYISLSEENVSIQGQRLGIRSVEISTQTEERREGGTVIGAIFILMNAVLGAGILEFPYIFSRVGLITAFMILTFMLLCACVTHMILAQTVELTHSRNYHQLIGHICGRKILITAQILLIIYTWSCNVAYLVTVGDQLTKVCNYISHSSDEKHEFYCDRRFLIPVTSVLVISPIIWFKNISNFSYVSFFSVASVFYLVAAIFIEYITTPGKADVDLWYPPSDANSISILSILPAISFAYQCHMTSVPLYAELKERSVRKYVAVIGVSMFLTTSSYLLVGITGFALFGYEVNPDVIMSFPANSLLISVGRVAITLAICMTFPIVMFIGRGALEGAAIELTRNTGNPLQQDSPAFFYPATSLWFVSVLVVATFATQLNDVIRIAGSIAASFMFFFPGCIVISLSWSRRNYAHTTIGCLFCLLGAAVFILNIIATIQDHAAGHPHQSLE